MNLKVSLNSYQKIYFYTTNSFKLKVAKHIFKDLALDIVMVKKKLKELQTMNILENVKFKLKQVDKLPAIVEDSGLFIKNLRGFPGTITKYVLKTIGFSGIQMLLKDDTFSYFISVVGYKDLELEKYFIGKVTGMLKKNQKSIDEAFIPTGSNKSFAEMNLEEFVKYSDIGRSLTKLKRFLVRIYKLQCCDEERFVEQ